MSPRRVADPAADGPDPARRLPWLLGRVRVQLVLVGRPSFLEREREHIDRPEREDGVVRFGSLREMSGKMIGQNFK